MAAFFNSVRASEFFLCVTSHISKFKLKFQKWLEYSVEKVRVENFNNCDDIL